jgi:hypothetical protein
MTTAKQPAAETAGDAKTEAAKADSKPENVKPNPEKQ